MESKRPATSPDCEVFQSLTHFLRPEDFLLQNSAILRNAAKTHAKNSFLNYKSFAAKQELLFPGLEGGSPTLYRLSLGTILRAAERIMLKQFPDQYAAYQQRVKHIIPFVL
jgi:hypothetical protein